MLLAQLTCVFMIPILRDFHKWQEERKKKKLLRWTNGVIRPVQPASPPPRLPLRAFRINPSRRSLDISPVSAMSAGTSLRSALLPSQSTSEGKWRSKKATKYIPTLMWSPMSLTLLFRMIRRIESSKQVDVLDYEISQILTCD